MKIFYGLALITFLSLAAGATNVLAIGSGSGGSAPAPSCTQSTWTCTDWSSCSTSGTQTRNCNLTFSCPGANTPEPATTQSCTPPTPSLQSSAATQPVPTPQPSAATQPVVFQKPTCTASKWECSSWSPSCDIYGQKHRSCLLVVDCPSSPTPPPFTSEACTHLQCGNLSALHDRIACRLNLAPEGAIQELKIQYLPEECRVLTDKTERNKCIARYKSYSPCWNLPAGEGRFACARQVLNLGNSVSDETKQCQEKIGTDRASCEQTLKEKVLYMIKFRFYDLEQRAEDLARRGAHLDAVIDFETTVETKKQEFDSAQSKDQLMRTILDVRLAWQNFINQVKDQVK